MEVTLPCKPGFKWVASPSSYHGGVLGHLQPNLEVTSCHSGSRILSAEAMGSQSEKQELSVRALRPGRATLGLRYELTGCSSRASGQPDLQIHITVDKA